MAKFVGFKDQNGDNIEVNVDQIISAQDATTDPEDPQTGLSMSNNTTVIVKGNMPEVLDF